MSVAPESISARVGIDSPRILSRTGSLITLDVLLVAIMVGCLGGVVRGMAPLKENPFRDQPLV